MSLELVASAGCNSDPPATWVKPLEANAKGSDAPTPSSSSTNSNSLCQRCRLANFRNIFQRLSLPSFSDVSTARPVYRNSGLGNYTPIKVVDKETSKAAGGAWDFNKCLQERSCSFCGFLVKIMHHLYGQREPDIQFRAQMGPLSFDIQLSEVQFSSSVNEFRQTVGKEIEGVFKGVWGIMLAISPFETEPCLIHPLSTSQNSRHQDGWARRILKGLDINLVSSWLSNCDARHGEKCEKTKTQGPLVNLHLINVKKWCIERINGDDVPQYVALSYVWGSVSQPRMSKSNHDKLSYPGILEGDPGLHLPQTIKDAIELSQKLKIPYLWVDSLCIVQDDMESKDVQINQMHIIYHRARLTIIAAAGNNCDAGLVGVSRERNKTGPDFEADVGPFLVTAAKKSAFSDVLVSYWRSRGWTLQEEFFSRRKLFFTEDIIVFQCSEAHWREDIIGESTDNIGVHVDGTLEYGINSPVSEQTFRFLLQDYLSRDFSKPEDILSGFAGILQFMKPTLGDFFWGLPENGFAESICWDHGDDYPTNRRRGFPSWSWAGWSWQGYKKNTDFYRPKVDLWPSRDLRDLIRFYKLHSHQLPFNSGDYDVLGHDHFMLGFEPISDGRLSLLLDSPMEDLPQYCIAFFTSLAVLEIKESPGEDTKYVIKDKESHGVVATICLPVNWLSARSHIHEVIVIGYLPCSKKFVVMLIARIGKIAERVQLTMVDELTWWTLQPQRKLILLG